MKRPSFWEKDSFLKSYDLIVVGAGIVGLSTAVFYKRDHPAARVLVLDKGMLPEGASTRNAGFACIGSITEHMADLEKENEDAVKTRLQSRYNGLQLLRKLLGDQHIGYEACGGYEVFTDTENFEKAAPQITTFNTWLGDLVDEEKVYSTSRLNGYPVIYNRLEGALHPGKMMQRLVELVNREGVNIQWNTKVEEVQNVGIIKTVGGLFFEAQNVVIASNGFTKNLVSNANIKPARGYILITNKQVSMPWKGTFHYDKGYVYFRNIGNRLLIGGGRHTGMDKEETDEFGTNASIKEYLKSFVSDILKLDKGWQIEHEWSGIMGFTKSKTPVIKKLDDHRVVAAGLSGMGIAIGTDIGKKAAGLVHQK